MCLKMSTYIAFTSLTPVQQGRNKTNIMSSKFLICLEISVYVIAFI